MKKQWVRRSMRKALTMITLTSTIALVSPMMIQTGTVAYAVAQDQAVVLADNTVGHLSYSYQADEQNIYWSLDVQEKISNESAYVRLKIDSVDTVSVAGQSFAKDESGWIDLDTLSLGTAVQQVAFSTLKTDDQTLAVTAELVVPGEGEVKDEIHPIVTGGKLEADVPLVTELPDVDPGITAEKEDTVEIPAPEQIEEDTLGDSEASPEENASDTESSKQGMMSASPDASVVQAADEGLEIGSRGVTNNSHSAKITKSDGSTDISVGTSGGISTKYANAGDEIYLYTYFTLQRDSSHSNYRWNVELDPTTLNLSSGSSVSVEYKNAIGNWASAPISRNLTTSGNKLVFKDSITTFSPPDKGTRTYEIRIRVKTKADLTTDIRSPFLSKISYTERGSNVEKKQSSYYWVKARADKPTILTWDGTQTEKSDSREITTSGAYTANFQWTDEDAGDLLKGALTFKVLNSNQASATEISGSTAGWTGSGKDFGKGSISIPANQFITHGNKVFYLQAYKNGTKTGSSIKLTITVSGSLKLVSVPSALAWTGTLSDQEQILSRNEEMAVAVQDSRATGKGKGSFTLTMTSNEPTQNDFEFVWKGTAGSSAVTMENHTLGSNAFSNNNYTYTATYGTGAGILVKTNSNTAIQTTTRTITWSLNNTWTGS